jgi:myo-inositol-1(or 4)-monophosphatase
MNIIRRRFPGHGFLCEESGSTRGGADPARSGGYTWVIDPLDGTNNFASGLPIFCASVALKRKDTLLAGAVYDATRDELFYAEKGKGAYLNGRRIHVSRARSLGESLLITGFYYDRGKKMIEALQTIMEFQFRRILGIRRLGAAALDLCYVASGRAAGFWEFELSPWDFSAGKLIVEEAGGKVTGKCGEAVDLDRPYFIVSSNRKIHGEMISVINKKPSRKLREAG